MIFTDWQKDILSALTPPPDLLTSQWAAADRHLPVGLTSRPGLWKNETTPYGVGIMDATDDPETKYVVVMKGSQEGATEFALNVSGKRIANDPCPIMLVRPTIDSAREFSKTRFNSMWESTLAINEAIAPPRKRDSENSILFKMFPGGFIHFGGANSPSSLKSRACKFIIFDEVDEYPHDVKEQGDVIEMVIRRAETFPDSVFFLNSTPTIKGLSRIEAAFAESNQQYFNVPCPKCNHFQALKWSGVKWQNRDHRTAVYECEKCSKTFGDSERYAAVRHGKWVATYPEIKHIKGFHLNFLYAPWIKLETKVETFLKVKKNPERLKVFINQDLGEPWEDDGERVDSHQLFLRREHYMAEVPNGVLVLTTYTDTQDDRLETTVLGHGMNQETWVICHKVIWGNLENPAVWNDLDNFYQSTYEHEKGFKMRISCAGIDSGYHTKQVYNFVKPRQDWRIYATKGGNVEGQPLINNPRKSKNKGNVRLFTIGVHTAKSTLMTRLKINEPGPGFVHIPKTIDEEFCEQMTAEELKTKFKNGFPRRVWIKKRERNEALDCYVGNMAMEAILNPDYEIIARSIEAKATEKSDKPTKNPAALRRPKKSWVKRYGY